MTTTSRGPSRRTLVKGAAWSVPVVAVAGAAPAMAASQPIVVQPLPGSACKYGGNSCEHGFQAYRFTFCFSNGSDEAITVSLDNMRFADGRSKAPLPATVTVPANTANYCIYVIADNMGNSSNGQGFLDYSYTYDGENLNGSVQTGANDLPPCENCAPPGPVTAGGPMTPEQDTEEASESSDSAVTPMESSQTPAPVESGEASTDGGDAETSAVPAPDTDAATAEPTE